MKDLDRQTKKLAAVSTTALAWSKSAVKEAEDAVTKAKKVRKGR